MKQICVAGLVQALAEGMGRYALVEARGGRRWDTSSLVQLLSEP